MLYLIWRKKKDSFRQYFHPIQEYNLLVRLLKQKHVLKLTGTLDKSSHLSEPQFPHLLTKGITINEEPFPSLTYSNSIPEIYSGKKILSVVKASASETLKPLLHYWFWKRINYWERLEAVLSYSVTCMLSHSIWLFATPWLLALPDSSVHGISQARILE